MKKLLVVLAFACLLINCENSKKAKKEIAKKPVQSFLGLRLPEQKFFEIDIDSLQNFGDILNIIDTVDCHKNAVLVNVETDSIIYKIQHFNPCGVIYDYKLNEIIYIKTDTLIVNHELQFPINSIGYVINKHLINVEFDENYPMTSRTRLISINIDPDKSIQETKKLLLRVIENINALPIGQPFAFIFDRIGLPI